MNDKEEFLNWSCAMLRKDDEYWQQREMAEYEELQHTPKRGLRRPMEDFDRNINLIPKGK